jgi:hypothetical protein
VRVLLPTAAVLAVAGLFACGGPPAMPKGPAPDYEDPHTPTWMDAGGSGPSAPPPSIAPSPSADAG